MSDIIYYYVNPLKPLIIESTEILDELVVLLYQGTAQFISDTQRKELKLGPDYIGNLKKKISRYQERVPLYDIFFNHIYLIHKENVYSRIYKDNYRFVDQQFYEDLINMENPSDNDLENRRVLSNYNLDTLFKTYMKIFYDSFVFNKYITNCRRPSFESGMENISPYYTINELYYLAYDWNLTDKASLTEDEIRGFCKQIAKFDIPAKTLLDHQIYIYDSKAIGLVKYYSLFGSYYINMYLRKNKCCLPGDKSYENTIRNLDLENQIKIMIKLITNAPAFIKAHTVYRFIEKDEFLTKLKRGDIYQDSSFMSTTRNPSYYEENHSFGYILLKIKLPANIKGIGLCIESYSNFPKEEEIVLPPSSRFILDNIIEGDELTHFQGIFKIKVKRKYEFTCIGNDYIENKTQISFDMPDAYLPPLENIKFSQLLSDENIIYIPMPDRLFYFKDKFVNMNNQFSSTIGSHTYVFSLASYDSNSVYKPFFYYEVQDGIMITTDNPKYGNINLLLELGTEIHINYYFRFSVTDPSVVVDLDRKEWIEWLSMLCFAIGSKSAIIHSNYVLNYDKSDSIQEKQIKTRYTYSQNIYLYLKEKKKFFSQFTEIIENFDYAQLDYLFGVQINEVITPSDKNELYRIAQLSKTNNIGDFYIYVVEKFPKLIKVLEEKMDIIYEPEKNPFLNMSYTLDPWMYLYNRNLITIYPSDKEFSTKKGSFKKLIGDKKIQKFKNRLRTYLVNK